MRFLCRITEARRHTVIIFNANASMVTMVTQTRRNVTFIRTLPVLLFLVFPGCTPTPGLRSFLWKNTWDNVPGGKAIGAWCSDHSPVTGDKVKAALVSVFIYAVLLFVVKRQFCLSVIDKRNARWSCNGIVFKNRPSETINPSLC